MTVIEIADAVTRHAPEEVAPPGADIFQRNLDAIAQRLPALAERLRGLDISNDIRFMVGRDGSATAQIRDGGDWRWLGASSAPTLSGPEVAAGFKIERGNLALFGPGSGREIAATLARLASTQGLFVVCGDSGLDGLAVTAAVLRLVDLAEPIAGGRLVLAAESGTGGLDAFLESNPGFHVPGQVLRWPWQGGERFAKITAVLEAACNWRLERLAEEHEAVARCFESIETSPRIERVMTIAPAGEGPQRLAAEAIARAAGQGDCFRVSGADGASPLAQAAAVAEFMPDLLVLLGATRFDFTPPLPRSIRVATWLWSDTPVPAERVGEGDIVAAATPAIEQSLRQRGIDPARIVRLPFATDDAVYAPAETPAEHDLAIVGDVGSVDAAALGIAWQSHRTLWQQCLDEIEANPAGYRRGRAEQVLDRAASACGVAIRDASVRRDFVEAIEGRAGPTMLRVAYARAAVDAGLGVRLIGEGWDLFDFDASQVVRPVDWASRRNALTSAAAVALINDHANFGQDILDAAACGAALLVRRLPGDAEPGGLDELLGDAAETFATPRDFVARVRDLLGDATRRTAQGESARRAVCENHLFKHRLAALIKAF